MKRIVSILLVLSMVFGLVAFQCSSTEITSAKLYIQQKNYPKAIEALQKEVSKNPKSDEGYYLLGWLYGEQGKIDLMLENFEQSVKISNKFAQNIEDSKQYHWSNNFNKGVGMFNRATKTADTDSSNQYFDKSVAAFESAIACQPDSISTYQNLTFALFNAGRTDAAIKPLKKLIELSNSADSYAMLGEIYYNDGIEILNNYKVSGAEADSVAAQELFDKTINLLEGARKDHPSNAEILTILSNAYINANRLDEAMEAFKSGVVNDPENKIYRYNYGVLLLGAEQYPDAVEQFLKAIEIDSEYENAYYNLAVTYVKWGSELREKNIEDEENKEYLEKYEACLDPLNKFLELNPSDAAVWELLGKVYANLGRTEDSKAAFEKADQYR